MEAIYGLSDFDLNGSVLGLPCEIILLNDMVWEVGEFHAHVLISLERGTEVKICMSKHIYLAVSVLNTLFHKIFDVVRSAGHVVNSPG